MPLLIFLQRTVLESSPWSQLYNYQSHPCKKKRSTRTQTRHQTIQSTLTVEGCLRNTAAMTPPYTCKSGSCAAGNARSRVGATTRAHEDTQPSQHTRRPRPYRAEEHRIVTLILHRSRRSTPSTPHAVTIRTLKKSRKRNNNIQPQRHRTFGPHTAYPSEIANS